MRRKKGEVGKKAFPTPVCLGIGRPKTGISIQKVDIRVTIFGSTGIFGDDCSELIMRSSSRDRTG